MARVVLFCEVKWGYVSSVDLLPRYHLPGADPVVSIGVVLEFLGGTEEEDVQRDELDPDLEDLVPHGSLEADHELGDFQGEFMGIRWDWGVWEGFEGVEVEVAWTPLDAVVDA